MNRSTDIFALLIAALVFITVLTVLLRGGFS